MGGFRGWSSGARERQLREERVEVRTFGRRVDLPFQDIDNPRWRALEEDMVRYWLTTHYPHPFPDNLPWHIYLQRQHKTAVTGIHVDDPVFFYEYKKQKPIKGVAAYPSGRQGIVRVARVSGAVYERPTVIEYANGTKGYWTWGIPTDRSDTSGFARLKDVLKVIDYSPGSVLFGFNGGTGVMELNEEQYTDLLRLFKAGKPQPSPSRSA